MSFSVLMSVYNKENAVYFDASLDSILSNQSIIPDEFVLVCDGPLTDELNMVVDKFEEEYHKIFKVFRLDKNSGLGNALNYGLSKCTFELVARADSDDICVKDRFEKQLQYFEKHPEYSAVGSSIDEFVHDPLNPMQIKLMPQNPEKILKLNIYRNPMNHMTVMFKKTDIMSVGSYMHLQYVEDYYLWERLLANGYKLANMEDILVHARVGNGMVARRGSKEYIVSWKTLNQYKLANKLINKFQYLANMVMVRMFVFTPVKFKEFLYKKILRR